MDAARLLDEAAPTMGVVAKINYSHRDMIDTIIANPGISQNALAARYGYTPGWVSNVMASDAWQSAMAARRAEITDPVLVATVEERFRGIVHLSQKRLLEKLEAPVVSDSVVLRAMELGAKSLGMGAAAPPPQEGDRLERLANRLIDLQSNVRKGVTLNGQVTEVAAEAIEAGGPQSAPSQPQEAAI